MDQPAWLGWPTQCMICRSWSGQAVCGPCLQRFAPVQTRCSRCALPLPSTSTLCPDCMRMEPPFERCIAAVDYSPPWTDLLTRFKFHAEIELAAPLAKLLAGSVQAAQAAGRSTVGAPDLVLPVPISAKRMLERGYNQAWELARRLARSLNMAADASLLVRLAHTAPQVGMSRQQRLRNVRHAFAVDPLRRQQLAGRHIAVVDDVFTTGATAWELARTLKQAGATRVEVWSVARTP